MLIDGRNRRAACKIAGVEPSMRDITGQDPTDYLFSKNIYRKHLTKGHRAMGVALLFRKFPPSLFSCTAENGARNAH